MVEIPNNKNSAQKGSSVDDTPTERMDTYSPERLLRAEVSEKVRIREGLPDFALVDWQARQKRWDFSRDALEKRIPNIFTMEYFLKLERVGGGREAEARELIFGKDNKFISASGQAWEKAVIKRFYNHSRTDQIKQARAMHSLHLLMDYWFENGLLPGREDKPNKPLIKVPEFLTYKYPFGVMRSLNSPDIVRVDGLEERLRRIVYNKIFNLGHLVYTQGEKIISRYKSAGLEYPNPDFNAYNVFAEMRSSRLHAIWVIDQASAEGGPTYEGVRRRGSSDILNARKNWGF